MIFGCGRQRNPDSKGIEIAGGISRRFITRLRLFLHAWHQGLRPILRQNRPKPSRRHAGQRLFHRLKRICRPGRRSLLGSLAFSWRRFGFHILAVGGALTAAAFFLFIIGAFVVVTFLFLDSGADSGELRLNVPAAYAAGSVEFLGDHNLYLVKLRSGTFLALADLDAANRSNQQRRCRVRLH